MNNETINVGGISVKFRYFINSSERREYRVYRDIEVLDECSVHNKLYLYMRDYCDENISSFDDIEFCQLIRRAKDSEVRSIISSIKSFIDACCNKNKKTGIELERANARLLDCIDERDREIIRLNKIISALMFQAFL